MSEKAMARADFLMSLVLIAFGVYVTYVSWRMPRFEETKSSIWAAPGLVTGLIGLLFIGSGVIFFLRATRANGHRIEIDRSAIAQWFDEPGNRRLVITCVLCLLYGAVLVGRMPFVVATAVFVFVFIFGFEFKHGRPLAATARSTAIALAVAVPAALAVTLVFEKLFLVTLP